MFVADMTFLALLTATAREKTRPAVNCLKVPLFFIELTSGVLIHLKHNLSTFA